MAARLRARIPRRQAGSVSASISSTEDGGPPLLRFRVAADTAVQPFTLPPFSKTPTDDDVARAGSATTPYSRDVLRLGAPPSLHVGGFPPRRSYLRFNIPSSILDSSTVIRATLLLNQIPNPVARPD